MAVDVEFLRPDPNGSSKTGKTWFDPCRNGAVFAGLRVQASTHYRGVGDWLSLFGIGSIENSQAAAQHRERLLPVAAWDLGYLGRSPMPCENHLRVSLNGPHPSHRCMAHTSPNPTRWERLGLSVSEQYAARGHVVVVGMGVKSRNYLGLHCWEETALARAAARFPDRKVVYRPKLSTRISRDDEVIWPKRSLNESIQDLLNGASLVICRHSNVAIDACIAGIPVECEAGAAHWLYRHGTTPSVQQRLDFLYRLCWWQWKNTDADMEQAWRFLTRFER